MNNQIPRLSTIGITGLEQSGKNFFSEMIAQRLRILGYRVEEISFAAPVKKVCCDVFGWTPASLEDGEFKATVDPKFGVTPRFAMRSFATDWARNMISDTIWVDAARAKIEANQNLGIVTIVTDVRFDNEAKMIKSFEGSIVRVVNRMFAVPPTAPHESEAGIAVEADFVFKNRYLKDFSESELHLSHNNALRAVDAFITDHFYLKYSDNNGEIKMEYTVSDACAALVMGFEGFEAKAYRDAVGIPTIGYGLTRWFGQPGKPRVKMGETIDRATAFQELLFTLQYFWEQVEGSIRVPLDQNQADAITSFVYNIGPTAFIASTFLRKLNNGDFEGAANEFKRWNKAEGKVLLGLVRRRASEEKLFRGKK